MKLKRETQDAKPKEAKMARRLSKEERMILAEASRIRRKYRINEMADLDSIADPDPPLASRDERIRRAIVNGEMKNLELKDLSNLDLRGADLRGANLRGANLSGADFRNAKFHDSTLERANFKGANLEEANLQRANFLKANMEGANLRNSYLSRADLRKVNLDGANLDGANLWWADLRRAVLTNASLEGASIRDTRIQGANLDGATLPTLWDKTSKGKPAVWPDGSSERNKKGSLSEVRRKRIVPSRSESYRIARELEDRLGRGAAYYAALLDLVKTRGIAPYVVVGGGYKDGRRVAIKWLEEKIEEKSREEEPAGDFELVS